MLESRKLIKSVKSVASSNRKVYMLSELEPSREITGGAWYTEHEYDKEFIDVLRDQCLKFVLTKARARRLPPPRVRRGPRRRSAHRCRMRGRHGGARRACVAHAAQRQASLDEMCEFVSTTGLSKVQLGSDEVLQIVNTLVYDGKARGGARPYIFPYYGHRVPRERARVRGGCSRGGARSARVDGRRQVDAHESRGEAGNGGYADGTVYYTAAALAIPDHSALTSVPCGVCPVFNECHDGGVISPQTCIYYAEWLQF